MFVLPLLKLSEILRNDVIDYITQVRFISTISVGSTGSSVTDQEAVLLYISILTLTTPTVFESIESPLKKQDEWDFARTSNFFR